MWAAPRQWVPEALTLNLHHAGPGGTGGNVLVLFCALLLLRRWLWQPWLSSTTLGAAAAYVYVCD